MHARGLRESLLFMSDPSQWTEINIKGRTWYVCVEEALLELTERSSMQPMAVRLRSWSQMKTASGHNLAEGG
jgi:hypothetical protein